MKLKTKRNEISFEKKTIIMGILNVTPDSFSDGGKFENLTFALRRAKELIDEGADIIDIGGESTRPGADRISVEEELHRVIPVIEAIRQQISSEILISIDTYKADVAKTAVEKGADIINDVSGLQLDPKMIKIVGIVKVPVIINHMRGNPKTMQQGEIVYNDIMQDISSFFSRQVKLLMKVGYLNESIILDPGFGFGKTVQQNFEIIKRINELKSFNIPLMIGISRKSSLGKILNDTLHSKDKFLPSERLEAALAATAVAVEKGINIVRTHDVFLTRKFLTVYDAITKQ